MAESTHFKPLEITPTGIRTFSELTSYFQVEELMSPDTRHNLGLLDVFAVHFLTLFRKHIDKPFLVNHGGHTLRGLRSAREQQSLSNGAQLSMHVTGKAFDVTVPGLTSEELAEKAVAFGWSAVGIYPTFCHLDTRTLFGTNPVLFKRV